MRINTFCSAGGRRGSRPTAEWVSVYTAEGLQGAGALRGGSGVRSGPEAEAGVRDLFRSGRRSTWINKRRRGDKRSPRE
jgi:hypothetical protein